MSVFQNLISLGFGIKLPHFGVLPRALHWSGVTWKFPTTEHFGGGTALDLQTWRVWAWSPQIPPCRLLETLGTQCPLQTSRGVSHWVERKISFLKLNKEKTQHTQQERVIDFFFQPVQTKIIHSFIRKIEHLFEALLFLTDILFLWLK